MRTLIHLSNLDFGQSDDALVETLAAAAREARPDVVILSSGLTHGARRLLNTLRPRRLFVPGGRQHFYEDEELVVASADTKHGRIADQQLVALRERLCARSEVVTKIVVTHHPFDVPAFGDERDPANTGDNADVPLATLSRCGADVLLAGQPRLDHMGRTARRYDKAGHTTLVVHAGTAADSTSGSDAPNSFNLIRVQHPHIQVERHAWREELRGFKPASSETFRHTPEGWTRLSDEVAAGITFADDTTGLQPTIPQSE